MNNYKNIIINKFLNSSLINCDEHNIIQSEFITDNNIKFLILTQEERYEHVKTNILNKLSLIDNSILLQFINKNNYNKFNNIRYNGSFNNNNINDKLLLLINDINKFIEYICNLDGYVTHINPYFDMSIISNEYVYKYNDINYYIYIIEYDDY